MNHPLRLIATLATFSFAHIAYSAQGPGELVFRDDFKDSLAEGWYFEREEKANWRTGPNGLEVRVQPGGMWGGGNNAKNVFVRPIPAPTDALVEISVTVSNVPSAQWEQANLVWYYDAGNMVKLGQELVTGRLSIVMGREENDRARTVAIVPLDGYAVELRLQAVKNMVRGEYRTAPWREWRYVGECDLPVKGDPKASLHFYNGPAREEHWVRVNNFTVSRLAAAAVNWPRVRETEKVSRGADNPRSDMLAISLPEDLVLFSNMKSLAGEPKADFEQAIYTHSDQTYGWRWTRRNSVSKEPIMAGIAMNPQVLWGPADSTVRGLKISDVESLELDMDVVTRLENDQGDHNFLAVMQLKPEGRVAIWFDWYGKASEVKSLNDGYRDYGHAPTAGTNEVRYLIQGFRGAPPRVNLKPFLVDAVKRGVSPESEVVGGWFGNEIWNGSRGSTLVKRLDLRLNGKNITTTPGAGAQ